MCAGRFLPLTRHKSWISTGVRAGFLATATTFRHVTRPACIGVGAETDASAIAEGTPAGVTARGLLEPGTATGGEAWSLDAPAYEPNIALRLVRQ
jgi:hypothetical protein